MKPILTVITGILLTSLGLAIGLWIQAEPWLEPAAAEPQVVEKVVYKDWDHYIPVAAPACLDMVDKGVRMYDRTLESDRATLEAAKSALEENYTQASESIRDAERLLPGLSKSRKVFLKQAQKCEAGK